MTIYKNKGEIFECQFKIDGATIEDTVIRLCLEFEDNKNLFFYGTLKHDGTCTIDIPTLKELKNTEGKLVVEAIADSTYFRLYEAEVEFKNSIEIEMTKKPAKEPSKKTAVKLEQILSRKPKPKIEPKEEEKKVEEGWESIKPKNPYRTANLKTEEEQVEEKEEKRTKLTKFDNFMKKRNGQK